MMKRQIRIEGNVAYVPLTRGYEAVIDAADVAKVSGLSWRALILRRRDGSIKAVYAQSEIGGRTARLHRVVSGAAQGVLVDHRDGDGLNCRSANLRPATVAQNGQNQRMRVDNTSGFKGAHWDSKAKRWQARIAANGRRVHLGMFGCKTAAWLAYLKASAAMHGDFGRAA